MSFMKNMFF